MDSRVATPVLWLRACVAGSFAFFLGVVGHVVAAGLLPGTPFLVALYAFSVLMSVPVLQRPASPLRVVALLVGGQTFIHLCLTATAGHVGDPRPTGTTPRPSGPSGLPVVDGHRVGSFQDAFAGSGAAPAQTPTLPLHHLVADLQAHAPMMAAHLAAAALVGLWLAHGERLLFALVALTARVVRLLVAPWLPVHRPATAPRAHRGPAADRLRDMVLGRAVPRRGPPLLAG